MDVNESSYEPLYDGRKTALLERVEVCACTPDQLPNAPLIKHFETPKDADTIYKSGKY